MTTRILPMTDIDYLLIGHITKDLTPGGHTVGGTVTYSGRTARLLGCHTAVLTSTAPAFDGLAALAGLEVINIPAAATSTFENVYTPDGRVQTIYEVAAPLQVAHLPAAWRRPAIVHLAPLANEVSLDFLSQFPHSLIGVTPQGWLRRWGDDGRVFLTPHWEAAQAVLSQADVVILSQEEVPSTAVLWQYWQWANLLVLTGGDKGCIIFQGGSATHIPATPVMPVDATGAGDIFAAAFFIRYHQTRDALAAARFATGVASQSVTQTGITAVMAAVETAVAQYQIV